MSKMTKAYNISLGDSKCSPVEKSVQDEKQFPQFVWTQRRVIVLSVLMLACGVQDCSYGLLVSFYPAKATKKDNTATQFGFVFGVYPFVGFVTSPLWGKLMATKVRAKTMLVAGILIDGIFMIALGFAKWVDSGWPFFIYGFSMRFLEAIGFSMAITCYYAIIAAEFKERVERFLPIIETVFGLGIMIGPTFGAILYDYGGFAVPFFVFGSLIVLQAVIVGCFLPNPEQDYAGEKNEDKEKTMGNLLDFHTWVNIACVVVTCFIIGFNDATLAVHLDQFNLSTSVKGLGFLVCGGVYAIASLTFGPLCKSVKDCRYFIIIGNVSILIAFMFSGPLPIFKFKQSLTVVLLMQVLVGFGAGATYVCSYMNTLIYVTKEKNFANDFITHALLCGILSSAFSLGAFLGPIAGGVLLDSVGYRMATRYVIIIIVFILSVLLIAVIFDEIKSTKSKTESKPLKGPLTRQLSLNGSRL